MHIYFCTYIGVESDGGGPDLVDHVVPGMVGGAGEAACLRDTSDSTPCSHHVVPGMVGGARETACLRARRSIKRARTLIYILLYIHIIHLFDEGGREGGRGTGREQRGERERERVGAHARHTHEAPFLANLDTQCEP